MSDTLNLDSISWDDFLKTLKSKGKKAWPDAICAIIKSVEGRGWGLSTNSTAGLLIFESYRWQRTSDGTPTGEKRGDFVQAEFEVGYGFLRVECFDEEGSVNLYETQCFSMTGYFRGQWKTYPNAEKHLLCLLQAADIVSKPFCREHNSPLRPLKPAIDFRAYPAERR